MIPIPGLDPEVIRAMMAADTKLFEEAKAQYGEPRAAALSELANLATLAMVMPAISASVDNLIPHSITGFGIPMEEGMRWITRFREGRMMPRTSPGLRAH